MKQSLRVFLLIALVALGSVVWWKISTSPVNFSDKVPKNFIISRGEGLKTITANLKQQALIRDELSFLIMSKKLGIEKKVQAGSFRLAKSMTAFEIATKLTLGTEDVWITVPEGWRKEEIIDYLQKQNIATPEGVWNEEGKYFPETYLVPKQFTLDAVRKLMRKTFDEKVLAITNEQLIIASIIEREARKETDRPMVSSVIWNRYKIGMKLDIDATVQYAVGFWKKDLTLEDLAVKSPYNTYLNAGLPPTPICNPGLSAIKAAQNPAKTDYLYYLTDKDGNTHFANTIEQHNANVAKYLGL